MRGWHGLLGCGGVAHASIGAVVDRCEREAIRPVGHVRVRSEDRITYGQAVWETFQQRAGTTRDMSSAEFHLLSKWMGKNMPLPIVERGIAETGGTPKTLFACEAAVERCYEYWFRAMGGL